MPVALGARGGNGTSAPEQGGRPLGPSDLGYASADQGQREPPTYCVSRECIRGELVHATRSLRRGPPGTLSDISWECINDNLGAQSKPEWRNLGLLRTMTEG